MRGKSIALLLAIIVGLWILVEIAVWWTGYRDGAAPSAEGVASRIVSRPAGGELPVLWAAPAFSYPNQGGKVITEKDLRGYVWISDFFFTSCTSICPMMTARMSQLQKTLTHPGMRFVSFSVDPEHDTPQVLKAYARMWKAEESRWHFLSTTREKLVQTAAGMKIFVQPPDQNQPIQHSSIFSLADGQGRVRGVYDSSSSTALQRLAADALTLAGRPPADLPSLGSAWAVPDTGSSGHSPGAALYVAHGCAACHGQQGVAPNLAGRFGTQVLLADGRTVTVDEAYLRRAILQSGAEVAAGFPRLMPSYRGQLTEVEVDQLVEYLKTLPALTPPSQAAGTAPPPRQTTAIDPVCKMSVEVSNSAIQAVHQNRVYYFCSAVCREQFLKSPGKYIGKSSRP